MRTCLTLVIICLLGFTSFAENNLHHNDDPLLKTYIQNIKRMPDEVYQSELRNQSVWQNFLQQHGTWYVIFNEENSKPHRAFGKPIAMAVNNDAVSTAYKFINTHLNAF